ncbi:hypothetical protein [Helicobacter sp.]|uniref:hypothetical protein n=1 Tax=Helicobacter sp. TaxID=218 RepID=UPI00388E379F
MSYTLPKTDKRFLRDFGQRPTPFVHHHTCENHSYTQTITNPNTYSVEIVVSMQGGSGDSNRATYDSDRKYWDKNRYNIWRYTYAGRVGNTLTLSLGGKVLATAGGGGGTPSYEVANYQGYQYKGASDDHSHTIKNWTYNGKQNLDCRQGGEQVALILTLKPSQSATITITHNTASSAPNTGSYCISGYV